MTMNATSGYESVTALLKGIGADPKFTETVEDELQSRSLARALVVLRHKANLTQKEVAARMNVQQGTVSKLERSLNVDLKVGDLQDYVSAVGGQICLTVQTGKPSLAKQVKSHVVQIHRLLHQLAALSEVDNTLGEPIQMFFGEALYNFVRSVESASLKVKGASEPLLRIEVLDESEGDCECDPQNSDLTLAK